MAFRRIIGTSSTLNKQYSKKTVQLQSTILSGEVLPKDHEIFRAIGATEELLSAIAVAREHATDANHEYTDKLKRIQTIIIEISTAISINSKKNKSGITNLHVKELDDWMVLYCKELLPPETYIIPGGGVISATLHFARSICRKTERYIIPYVQKGTIDVHTHMYLNKLSDLLLVLSRVACKLDKGKEMVYIPKANHKVQKQ